jgi:hypothetical protein
MATEPAAKEELANIEARRNAASKPEAFLLRRDISVPCVGCGDQNPRTPGAAPAGDGDTADRLVEH